MGCDSYRRITRLPNTALFTQRPPQSRADPVEVLLKGHGYGLRQGTATPCGFGLVVM